METVMSVLKSHAIVMLLLAVNMSSASQASVPDVEFRVAVRQKQHNKIMPGVHVLTLRCASERCSLTSVSVNQCSSRALGTPAFPIVVEFSSTSEGTLRVSNVGTTLKVEELASDIGGEAASTFLFGYEVLSDGTVARLTGFSGGFVKHSLILDRVITVEYVPYRRSVQSVQIDCPVLVPGLDLTEFDDLIEALSPRDQALWKQLQGDSMQPFITDENRARRLFPDYEKIKTSGKELSDEQWQRYVHAYLDELDSWLEARSMSSQARRAIREFRETVLLEQVDRQR
jgi:hypothetical protein